MCREITNEEKLKYIEELFIQYGAVQTDLDSRRNEEFEERPIFSRNGIFFRTGILEMEGKQFIQISAAEDRKFADVGILEDIDLIRADAGQQRIEKAVRYALGIEPYPEMYP